MLVRLVAVTLLIGCAAGDSTGPGAFGPVASRAITEVLADSLDPAGYFPAGLLVEEEPGILTSAEARRLANAYFRTFAEANRERWSEDRGAPIAASSVRACGPTMAAEGSYDFDSPPDEHLARSVAGRYLIHGCNQSGDIIALLSISSQGWVDTTASGYFKGIPTSNTFFSVGVPFALTDGMVLSAERAAELAHTSSGLRVAAIPRLYSSLRPDAPHFARWEILLEDTLHATGVHSAASVATAQVLIGFDASTFVPTIPRLLRAITRATASDPLDSLPAHDFAGDTLYWVPTRVRTGRPRSVEPILRVP